MYQQQFIFNVTLEFISTYIYYPEPFTSEREISLSGTLLFCSNRNALFCDLSHVWLQSQIFCQQPPDTLRLPVFLFTHFLKLWCIM